MKPIITDHAIERFQERFGRGITHAQSREVVLAAMRHAKRLHSQGSDRAIYEGPPPARMRMVVRHPDTKHAAVLTVLFASLDGGDESMGEVYGPLPDPPVYRSPQARREQSIRERELEEQLNRAMRAGLQECNRLRTELAQMESRMDEVARLERYRCARLVLTHVDDHQLAPKRVRAIAAQISALKGRGE